MPLAAQTRDAKSGSNNSAAPDKDGAPANAATGANSSGPRARRFQWTIARKIGGLASVLILFILLLLAYSIYTLRGIQGELEAIANLDVPLTELTNKIEIEQLEQQITMDQLLRLARRTAGENNGPELRSAMQRLEAHSTALEQNIGLGIRLSERASDTGLKPIFDRVKAALRNLRLDAERLHIDLFRMARVTEEGGTPDDQAVDTVLARGSAFDKKMLALIGEIEQFTEREINILESHTHKFLMVNTAFGAVGVLLGIILSTLINIGIRGNLYHLTR